MPEQDVKVIITPSTAQYREIVRHLGVLRGRGDGTNTGIILDALRDQADRVTAAKRPDLKAA